MCIRDRNNLVLSGTTTAIAGTLSIQPNDPARSIRIEATPSTGLLSLTPTQFATPVSYTHLDVYKRQAISGFCWWRPDSRRCTSRRSGGAIWPTSTVT